MAEEHHSLLIGAQRLVLSHRISTSVWISTMGNQMLCYKCLWLWSSWILHVLIISQKVPSYTRPSSLTELIHFLLETRQIRRLTWVDSWELGVYTVSLRTIWNKIDLCFSWNVLGHLLVFYKPWDYLVVFLPRINQALLRSSMVCWGLTIIWTVGNSSSFAGRIGNFKICGLLGMS